MMNQLQHQGSAVKQVYVFCMPECKRETDKLTQAGTSTGRCVPTVSEQIPRKHLPRSDGVNDKDHTDIKSDLAASVSGVKHDVQVVPIAPKLARKPFQKYCNMLHVSRSYNGKLSHYCLSVPIFCTLRNLESLIPRDEDKPAYLLRDEKDRIKGIMVDNLRPANYLIYRPPRSREAQAEVFMPDGCMVADENFNMVRWYIEQIELSPYLACPTDPFPGQQFIMLGAFSDTSPITDISCLDFPEIVEEIEAAQENADSAYHQVGPECNHVYYYLILSRLQTLHTKLNKKRRKFTMRLNFVDKNSKKQKALKAKKKKIKPSKVVIIEVFDEGSKKDEQEGKKESDGGGCVESVTG